MQTVTHIEVVLIDSQKLPDELLALSEEWRYLSSGIYSIAQTDLARALTSSEHALFEQLTRAGNVTAWASRARTIETRAGEPALPDWAEP